MIYVIAIIIVLSVLVFFHELGHFILAKLFGVRVERFSIGFPPRVAGIKIGDTDYCISAIPFGGYVKMSGVIDESMDASSLKGEPYEFASKKWWQKVFILIGGVTMNMILAWVIISGLFHFEGEPIIPTTTVGRVAEDGIARQVGIRAGDRIVKINERDIRTWNDVRDAYLANLGNKMVFTVRRDGETKQIVLSRDILEKKNSDQLDIFPRVPARVGDVMPESPASKAGLQRGDRIISIAGQQMESWEEMTKIVRKHAEDPLPFEIERNGRTLIKTITPEPTDEIDEDGNSHIVGKIGIGVYFEKRNMAFFPALVEGASRTVFFTRMNVKALGWLITGKKSAREMLGGPIMITKMAGDFAKTGFSSLMELIAHLSIMLAIVNILPIPALDGGHIAIVLIEGIRRKPLSMQTKMKIQQVGMAILLVLIVFVMYNDILRLL